MGRIGRSPETREFVFSDVPYIAIYRIDDERTSVEILRIMHTARRYPRPA
jgi:toxin ParE1/3/4